MRDASAPGAGHVPNGAYPFGYGTGLGPGDPALHRTKHRPRSWAGCQPAGSWCDPGVPPQKNHIKQHRLCPNLLPQLPAPGKSFPFGLALPNSERSRTLPIPTARHRVSRLLPGPSRQRQERWQSRGRRGGQRARGSCRRMDGGREGGMDGGMEDEGRSSALFGFVLKLKSKRGDSAI